MRLTRRAFVKFGAAGVVGRSVAGRVTGLAQTSGAQFELVQPDLFNVAGGQPNCWADFNNDGHLDLFVGFKDAIANRLYRYDGARFTDVAAAHGLAYPTDTRAAAWGDFTAHGPPD